MGSIIAITDQVLFKLSNVRLGSDGIISLEYGELLDSIIWNVNGKYLLSEKSQGVCRIPSFLEIGRYDSLQICDGYLRGIGILNLQGFYEKFSYSIFP